MSDLKPGTLVMIDPKEWPSTTKVYGSLWVYMEADYKDPTSPCVCKSVATGDILTFERKSLAEYKEQPDAET